jgi:hypothetical protein
VICLLSYQCQVVLEPEWKAIGCQVCSSDVNMFTICGQIMVSRNSAKPPFQGQALTDPTPAPATVNGILSMQCIQTCNEHMFPSEVESTHYRHAS